MTDFPRLIQVLGRGGVRFIIVGGFAGTLHGSSVPTRDLDIVYSRDPGNVRRLVEALAPYSPYLRGAPPGLPFLWDPSTIEKGLNFTLICELGAIDLLGEIAGGGDYEHLLPDTVRVRIFGVECDCLTLDSLIKVKRAAGRTKDLLAVADLEALREERDHASDYD